MATPAGAGGIGVVRLSGPESGRVVARLLGVPEATLEDRRMRHGVVRDPVDGSRLDDVLAVVMRGPRSYTGEDAGEIQAHGGAANLARILRAAVAAGARLAAPGEFTRRAFENGRIDLTQAEAVADVIGAASERALRVGQAQLGGAVGRRVAELERELLAVLAEVEASIDFPEEDLAAVDWERVAESAGVVAEAALAMAASHGLGRALREGIEVALVGRPNVGKSSLMNALLEAERAVVTAEPGTTRDYLEAGAVWDGIPVTLIDTAGERDPRGEAERRGLALGRERVGRVDVVVRVHDATSGEVRDEETRRGDAREIVEVAVWNKVDLAEVCDGRLGVSAVEGTGLAELRRRILAIVAGNGVGEGREGEIVTSERQRGLLLEAGEAAGRAQEAARARMAPELVASDLRAALGRLGEIVGRDASESVLAEIFARFCIGK